MRQRTKANPWPRNAYAQPVYNISKPRKNLFKPLRHLSKPIRNLIQANIYIYIYITDEFQCKTQLSEYSNYCKQYTTYYNQDKKY